MSAEDFLMGQLPRMANIASGHWGRKAKMKPLPPLPDGVWDGGGEPGPHFTVGFGRVPFTPKDVGTKTYYLAGYGTNRPAQSVHADICASAAYLDDNSGKGALLLVSLDCVGLMNPDVGLIRKKLEGFCGRTGCRAVNIMSTHSHAAPDTMGMYGKLPKTGRDKAFMDSLYSAVCRAAWQAYNTRKDGRLYAGDIEADGIQKDIRYPEVFCRTLTRIRFVPDGGGTQTWIVNFAAHPEVMDQRNRAISADYVHFMRKKIESIVNAKVIYFNGAIGGMITPIEIDKDDFMKSVTWAGEKIAECALKIDNERELKPLINTIRQEFYVDLANIMFFMGGLLNLIPRPRYATGSGPLNISLKTEMNYMEIGDVHILTIPGELFPELQIGGYLQEGDASIGGPELSPKPLRELANDEKLIVFCLGCDELGYIVPPNDYLLHDEQPFIEHAYDAAGRKHYEETNSAGPQTAARIAETFEKILKIIGRM
ncbi:MAG: hypothetical protein FWF08_01705 [Oscillospiraceae bacterium]|nr:hypothetical protein [Oscillospiraceae bacterium]